ncbi:NADP-dependent oxidoreductase, partial [Pseudomonas sp. MPR-R5A]
MIGFGIEQYGDEQQIKEIHVNTGKLGRNDLLIS